MAGHPVIRKTVLSDEDFLPKTRLLTYLDLCVRGEMTASVFAGNFEHVYLELDKTDLNASEGAAFESLFDKVAWVSPFEEERQTIPNNVGEHELLAAACKAKLALSTEST